MDVAHYGAAALDRLAVNDYDVVVLDRDLPVVHGDDVCRMMVESGSAARVLMLTTLAEVTDRVTGLCLGADDYFGKPFAFGHRARCWQQAVGPLPLSPEPGA